MTDNLKPFGYVLKTGHGNSFRETLDGVAPELRHLWIAVDRRTEPAGSAEPSTEYVAYAVVSERGGIHKLAIKRDSAERKAEAWQKEWPNNACRVRPLQFADAALSTQSTHAENVSKSAGESDMEKEREAFEKDVIWRLGDDPALLYRRTMPGAMFYGEYVNEKIQRHWLGWQARALLAAKGGE